jgi:hypothetical protein
LAFLQKCEYIASLPIVAMKFSQGFRSRYTANMLLPALYREKHLKALKKLWLLTFATTFALVLFTCDWLSLAVLHKPGRPSHQRFRSVGLTNGGRAYGQDWIMQWYQTVPAPHLFWLYG